MKSWEVQGVIYIKIKIRIDVNFYNKFLVHLKVAPSTGFRLLKQIIILHKNM